MRRLRARFADELVVVGVHSAKFTAEKETDHLRQAVGRLGIDHAVVNDAGFEVWQGFAVRAWPTVVLLDATGRVAGMQSGEVQADQLAPLIEGLIGEARSSELSERPRDRRSPPVSAVQPFPAEPGAAQPPVAESEAAFLRFPSKVTVAADGRLFVADTGHHRIVELRLDLSQADEAGPIVATVLRAFGRGTAGFADGSAAEATFHAPHGLAIAPGAEGGEEAGTLYVADTENHALRAIDLATGAVRTVAGTGALARRIGNGGRDATAVALRSPWDLVWADGVLLIAMAGSHQIWGLTPGGPIGPFAGTGAEALLDGPLREAAFNQPSGLALVADHLFVADAEASAIRVVAFDEEPRVKTLVGQGLFEFGDVDGVGAEVRLQHPAGIAADERFVYLADSYNHKVKRLDPASGSVETLVGDGRPGGADGPFAEARLHEPEGLALAGTRLVIADTGNHRLRLADLASGRVRSVMISAAGPDIA